MGERFAARVDLKADRTNSRLVVLASHLERGCDAGATAEALAAELRVLSQWLKLDGVTVVRRGSLARPLSAALGS